MFFKRILNSLIEKQNKLVGYVFNWLKEVIKYSLIWFLFIL